MTTMTFLGTSSSYAADPQYALGRADAYDDSAHLTIEALSARAAEYVEHAHLLTALGYMDRVLELRMEHDAVTGAETELAHSDRAKATT